MCVVYVPMCVQATHEEARVVLLYRFPPYCLETEILSESGVQFAGYKPPVFCGDVAAILNHVLLFRWVLGI